MHLRQQLQLQLQLSEHWCCHHWHTFELIILQLPQQQLHIKPMRVLRFSPTVQRLRDPILPTFSSSGHLLMRKLDSRQRKDYLHYH